MASPIGSERRIAGTFVVGDRVAPGEIAISAGRITGWVVGDASTRSDPTASSGRIVREAVAAPFVVAPGFIDVHVHGGGGASAMDGLAQLDRLASFLAVRGVTSFLPTSVSAPLPELARFVADVRAARIEQEGPGSVTDRRPARARILGASLEGPAIDPAHHGAHDPATIIDPATLLAEWRARPTDWAEVRIVTLAPERPGGLALVRQLAQLRVIASLGHSGATFDEARAAFQAGARSTTHLLNAMTGIGARTPGLAGAALADPRATVELIADGVHVDPGLWPVLWSVLGRRLLLVSDAMPAAGLGDGTYRLGSLAVSVSDGRARTAAGSLAGSTINVGDAVVNLVEAGLSLPRAVAAATVTPATLLGRRDLGRIRVGARADLVVLDPAGRVQRTMIDGEWLAERAPLSG
jgi:N-acetylglucosamine-6-phosphate deacetylase